MGEKKNIGTVMLAHDFEILTAHRIAPLLACLNEYTCVNEHVTREIACYGIGVFYCFGH